MKFSFYQRFIVEDTLGRSDVTPLFEDPVVFARLISDLVRPFRALRFNKVVGIDALGFVVSGAIALKVKKPLVLVRKGGKLPFPRSLLVRVSFKDYDGRVKSFELKRSSISKGDRVLLVDEWVETGSQMKSAIKLIERLGGSVVGIATINLDKHRNSQVLLDKYNCKALNVSV